MRLDKLRGFGPWLAYASPACLVLGFGAFLWAVSKVQPHQSQQSADFYVTAIFALVLIGLWMVTMLAVALDLEWIEHPLTHTGMTYFALASAAVGTLAFIVILATSLTNVPDLVAGILAFLWFAGVGSYLVVINLVGRRAGIFRGGLSAFGVVVGALFLVGALLVVVGLAAATMFPILPAILLYNVWSIWLGFVLRGRAPTTVMAPSGAPA